MASISMLLYGKAGTGKSVLANTFPKSLIFDFDGGHKAYESSFPDNKYIRGAKMLGYLQKAVEQIQQGTFQYETIVIDSLTNLENKAISTMKGFNSDNWSTSLYSGRGKKLGYDEWGNISGSTIALLTELREYPVNIVVITQIETTWDNQKQIFMPNLVGKGSNEALHFPDIVAYMTKDEEGRYLHLSSNDNDNFYAKCRSIGGDMKPITNPHYKKIIKIFSNSDNKLNFK